MYPAARALLFCLDPETAHGLVFGMMKLSGPVGRGLGSLLGGTPDKRLRMDVAGVTWAGPVGLAAGLDKDATLPRLWPELGFGAMELGTATALAQEGNPRPRLFRFPEAGAIVNRMGFNNRGATAMAERLSGLRASGWTPPIPLGVNIGKSKVTPVEDAVADYRESAGLLGPVADYLVVNVSSPNTPGLRSLQDPDQLKAIVTAVLEASAPTPVFVKLAPDLDDKGLEEAVRVAEVAGVAGIIATNTTIDHHGLPDVGAGGLSGRPLRQRALEVVKLVRATTTLPIVGVGGISSGADAIEMLRAGATVVQVYSGLIFQGPGLVQDVNRYILEAMDAAGWQSLAQWAEAGYGEAST